MIDVEKISADLTSYVQNIKSKLENLRTSYETQRLRAVAIRDTFSRVFPRELCETVNVLDIPRRLDIQYLGKAFEFRLLPALTPEGLRVLYGTSRTHSDILIGNLSWDSHEVSFTCGSDVVTLTPSYDDNDLTEVFLLALKLAFSQCLGWTEDTELEYCKTPG